MFVLGRLINLEGEQIYAEARPGGAVAIWLEMSFSLLYRE